MLMTNALYLQLIIPMLVVVVIGFAGEVDRLCSGWENQQWSCFDALLVIGCFSAISLCLHSLIGRDTSSDLLILLAGAFGGGLLLAIIVYLLIRWKYHIPFGEIGFSREGILPNISKGLVISATLSLIYLLLLVFRRFVLDGSELFYHFALPRSSLVLGLLYLFEVTCVGPVVEEITYRGFLYSPIRKRIGIGGAISVTAAIWSLHHLEPQYLLTNFLWGVFFVYLFERTRSLYPSIIVHAITNLRAIMAEPISVISSP